MLEFCVGWTVRLYESKRGDKPVEEFIKSCRQEIIARTGHHIDLLEKHGPFLGMPHARKVIGEIYELRIRGEREIRIFYAFHGDTIVLLHAFKKQAQKTPLRELDTAQKRLAKIKLDRV